VSEHSLRYAIATDLAKASLLAPHLRAIEVDRMIELAEASVLALEEVRYEAIEELIAKGHDLEYILKLIGGHFDQSKLTLLISNGRVKAKEQRDHQASGPTAISH
jgi:hypothetical protein